MDKLTIRQLEIELLKEFIRRSLNKFFIDRGFDNFKSNISPAILLNITDSLPFLKNMIEVKFFIEDYDLETNAIKVGWNLFILGDYRVFLGYTYHANVVDIERQHTDIQDSNINIDNIITQIVNVIGKSERLFDIKRQRPGFGDRTKEKFIMSTRPTKPISDFRRKV